METADTMLRVTEIIRETFNVPEMPIDDATTADDIDGWNSLSHAIFLLNLEEALNINFTPAEVIDVANVGELVRLIQHIRERDSRGKADG